ncbi:MAG: glycerophosphodiester phosphodiesterase, partial [Candidatus Omnitrophica bacterium]|nr:glycerophosphodiester phosphodiesterase [Candidatus Omnitrophota bacterium]
DKLTETSVRLLQEKGFEVWTWTVDEAKDWRRVVDLGVHGIITNKPGELLDWLKGQGLK